MTNPPAEVAEAITAALTAANIPASTIDVYVDALNLERFTASEGQPDAAAIDALAAKAAANFAPPPQAPPLHQGRVGSLANSQLRRQDLTTMTPDQIETARANGHLDDLLKGDHR